MTLDYVFTKCTGHTPEHFYEQGELNWFEKYTDNTEAGKRGILVANWNHFPHGSREWVKGQGYPDTIIRDGKLIQNGTSFDARVQFERILERLGYTLDWKDATSECDDCGNLIPTEPDCFFWRPQFYAYDGGITCLKCIRENRTQEYLEFCEKEGVACQWSDLDFASCDYFPVASEYPLTENPAVIYSALRAQGGYENVVVVDTHESDVVHTLIAYERIEWERS